MIIISMSVVPETYPNFIKFSVHVACGPGSVVLWWHCDRLCFSSLADDVMFSHNGPHDVSCIPSQ